MKTMNNLMRGLYMVISYSIWVYLYLMYVIHMLLAFNIKYIYRQLRLIYVCNYHGIYDKCVYSLWWSSLTRTSTAEKVYLTYGEFSTQCYLDLRCRIFGSINIKHQKVDEVVKDSIKNLNAYFINDGLEDNLKMRYLYAIIDNKIHTIENTKNHIKSIKNMIDYYGRDLYKKSINIII